MKQCEQLQSGASSVAAVLSEPAALKMRKHLQALITESLQLQWQNQLANSNNARSPAVVYEEFLWKKVFYDPLAIVKRIKKVSFLYQKMCSQLFGYNYIEPFSTRQNH